MEQPEINEWTGGKMSPGDALDKLQRDGFPVSQIVVEGYPARPLYNRRRGESDDMAQDRFATACRIWQGSCVAYGWKHAATEAIRLLIRHATLRARPAEWLEAKGSERALLRLAEEFCRFNPDCKLAYVFGSPDMIGEVAKQGSTGLPGGVPRDCLPGAQPSRTMAFMSTNLGFFERSDALFPVIVAHDAYAVAYVGRCLEGGQVTVGVMPTREIPGVVGASQEKLVERAEEILGASTIPNFDTNDFKARLALRRLLAKSDNPR